MMIDLLSQYRRDQLVTIYTDPLICHRPEGRARLVKLCHIQSNAEMWEVQFTGVQKVVRRWLRRNNDSDTG